MGWDALQFIKRTRNDIGGAIFGSERDGGYFPFLDEELKKNPRILKITGWFFTGSLQETTIV